MNTYENAFAESIGPLLDLIQATGFFEVYVYVPVMTTVSIYLFYKVWGVLWANGSFATPVRLRFRWVFLAAAFSMSFLVMNSTAVALKTMIIEETDYESVPWFMWAVSPLHFYISSLAGAYLWIIVRNQRTRFDHLLAGYLQIGLIAGYGVGFLRLATEEFILTNPTSGTSGLYFLMWFGFLNWDLYLRFIKAPSQSLRPTN